MAEGYEVKALEVYQSLKALASDAQAPPCVVANARKALASVWQIVNDLGLAFEQLYEYEV
ncbi:MAG: hypothetical protein Q8P59_05690 [Dehalococcoidia bacterium]|nr:hypothetical protein [Dehalococcoidia bacterium]